MNQVLNSNDINNGFLYSAHVRHVVTLLALPDYSKAQKISQDIAYAKLKLDGC